MGPKKTDEKKRSSEARRLSSVGETDICQPKIDQQFVPQSAKEMEEVMKKLDSLASKDFINETISKLKVDISEQVREEVNKVQVVVRQIQYQVSELEKDMSGLKTDISGSETKISELEKAVEITQRENRGLREEVREREKQLRVQGAELNNLEQYTRRNNIRIYGIDDRTPREPIPETIQKAVGLFRDKLQLDISTEQGDIAHRLGRFSVEANRPIMCRLSSRQDVLRILQARRKCKGSGIVIREDLTQKNIKLLEKVNALDSVRLAWSEQGKIVALFHNGTKKVIDHETDLTAF